MMTDIRFLLVGVVFGVSLLADEITIPMRKDGSDYSLMVRVNPIQTFDKQDSYKPSVWRITYAVSASRFYAVSSDLDEDGNRWARFDQNRYDKPFDVELKFD